MESGRIRVLDYMTKTPLTVGTEQAMSVAHRMMREHRIRHLPVLHGGTVVGVVSDGDLHLIETLEGVEPESVTIEEAMTSDPYCVTPDAPLADVVMSMAEHKYGCAVVVAERKVVGILTTVDVCRAFADFLVRSEAQQ